MKTLEDVGSTSANNKLSTGDSESRSASKRRSSRVTIEIPITVFGQSSDRKMFHEQVKTITVSAHGALVLLKSNIDSVRPALIVNPRTLMEVPCRVAFRREITGGGAEIGLEFSTSLPKFWGIHFPPDDWDPAERKRPASFQGTTTIAAKGSKP
jgi:PilZ domain